MTAVSFEQMEQKLLNGELNLDHVSVYHAAALEKGISARARKTFAALMRQHPQNVQINSLYISLCLEQRDDAAAMDAIESLIAQCMPDDGMIKAALTVRQRLGPKQIDKKQSQPSLSLCIIVRDEALYLPQCLHCLKPLADEIIVIDTGSTDDTQTIAYIFGAHVHNFTWIDDFSAARNYSLEKASGRWVLILDADEVIAPQDFEYLRRLMTSDNSKEYAYTFTTRNYTHMANAVGWQANDGQYKDHEIGLGWFPSKKVRLFQRAPEIRFHFPVHERVEPSLKTAGVVMYDCPVPVHHYGHLNQAHNSTKARQYYALGYAKLDRLNDDPAAIRELAVQAGQLERWTEAAELWHRLLQIKPDYAEAMVNLASVHWQMGRYDQSLQWSQKAAALNPDLKEAYFNQSVSYLLQGRAQKAAALLASLVNQYPDYIAARFMLAAAYACQGQPQKAMQLYQALKKTAAGAALAIAVRDLEQRMHQSGLNQMADTLIKTVSPLL